MRHRRTGEQPRRERGEGPGIGGRPGGAADTLLAVDSARVARMLGGGESWHEPREPVMVVGHGGAVKAYPLRILIYHEIVDDRVGGRPVAVTYCPLCNTALVFDRRVDGRTLEFGTTGRLRHSDLVMYDRETGSWWQQATGRGLVGRYAGRRLTHLAASTLAWERVRALHPGARVLSRETGHRRDYGRNPYVGYEEGGPMPGLAPAGADGRLPAMERVVAVDARRVPDGRDVGQTAVFRRAAAGRTLTFEWRDGAVRDRETGSRWNLAGRAEAGPLAGHELEPVPHGDHFWFAWVAFRPDTRLWSPGG